LSYAPRVASKLVGVMLDTSIGDEDATAFWQHNVVESPGPSETT